MVKRFRLHSEQLETRHLLATLVVTDLNDGSLEELSGDNELSFREAVAAINQGTIVDGFAPAEGDFGVDDRIELRQTCLGNQERCPCRTVSFHCRFHCQLSGRARIA